MPKTLLFLTELTVTGTKEDMIEAIETTCGEEMPQSEKDLPIEEIAYHYLYALLSSNLQYDKMPFGITRASVV